MLAMEKMKNILMRKPNPQQLLREWQRRLGQECRNINRQILDIEREEKNVQKAIKEAAKRNDMSSARAGVTEEMVNDTVDFALNSDNIEDEIEEEVDKVLTTIAGETAVQLPETTRKECQAEEESGNDEDLEDIQARLAKVRS